MFSFAAVDMVMNVLSIFEEIYMIYVQLKSCQFYWKKKILINIKRKQRIQRMMMNGITGTSHNIKDALSKMFILDFAFILIRGESHNHTIITYHK